MISHTAVRLAQAPVLLTRDPVWGPVLPADAGALNAALLEAAGVVPGWRRRLLLSRAMQVGLRWAERWTMRGVLPHVALRKRWLTDQAQAALAAGARQVLILGAGLDSLGLRLARSAPDVPVYELDMPPTAAVKRRALDLVGRPPNLWVVPADLARRPLADVLAELPWDPRARALVVAEGLTMYLPRAAIEALLGTIHTRGGPGTRLLFTHLLGDDAQRPLGLDPLTTLTLRVIGEPLRWGIDPAALEAFLAPHGFRLLAAPDLATLCATYGRPPTEITVGERLAAAETVTAGP